MDPDDNEEEDFPTAELSDQVWSEEPIPNRQQLCIHQIPCHSIISDSPRPATLPPWPIREVFPEPKLIDIEIMDDLPDIIDDPKELSSDFVSWAQSVLRQQW